MFSRRPFFWFAQLGMLLPVIYIGGIHMLAYFTGRGRVGELRSRQVTSTF